MLVVKLFESCRSLREWFHMIWSDEVGQTIIVGVVVVVVEATRKNVIDFVILTVLESRQEGRLTYKTQSSKRRPNAH